MTNFFKFSDYEVLKFCHISNINRQYCVAHLACLTLFWFMPLLYTHTSIHTRTHTHTHTHTRTFKLCDFWTNHAIQYTSYWDNTGLRNLMHSKFKFFNDNIKSKKDSGQIERNKVKHLHYLNKIIKKCKLTKFIFSKALCF